MAEVKEEELDLALGFVGGCGCACDGRAVVLRDALGEFFEFVKAEVDGDPTEHVDQYLTWRADRAALLRVLLGGQVEEEDNSAEARKESV